MKSGNKIKTIDLNDFLTDGIIKEEKFREKIKCYRLGGIFKSKSIDKGMCICTNSNLGIHDDNCQINRIC